MKKGILFLAIVFVSAIANAQKYVPEIKEGTVITTDATTPRGTFPVLFTFGKIGTGVDLMWAVDGYGDGTFEMSEKAVDNGTGFSAGQPALGVSKFDDKTILFISKKAYQDLMTNKMFMYDGLKVTIDTTDHPKFMLNEKEVDVTYVKNDDGKVKLTILNNPLMPLTLETQGLETDILVTGIK